MSTGTTLSISCQYRRVEQWEIVWDRAMSGSDGGMKQNFGLFGVCALPLGISGRTYWPLFMVTPQGKKWVLKNNVCDYLKLELITKLFILFIAQVIFCLA